MQYRPFERNWSAYARWSRIVIQFDSGASLGEVQADAESALAVATNARYHFAVELIEAPLRLIRTLRGVTPKFGSFDEEGFDEGRYERSLAANPTLKHASPRYWLRKLQARLFAGDYSAALAAAGKAQELFGSTHPTIEVAEYHFHAALARAAGGGVLAPVDLPLIVAHHGQLAWSAEGHPLNLADRVALVGAEIARLAGRQVEAERLYAEAIRLSQRSGFAHNEGLSHEFAARFHSARGFDETAAAHLRNARACYARWGADGKVRQLDLRQLPVTDSVSSLDDDPDFSEEFGAAQGFAGGSGFEHGEFDRWV